MNGLKEWAFSLASACIAGTMFYLIVPENNLEKNIKFIINVFFLCCMVVPFANGTVNIDWNVKMDYIDQSTTQNTENLNKTINQQLIKEATTNLEKQITAQLSNSNIKIKKISVFINTDEVNGISISSVEILPDKSHSTQTAEIKSVLQKMLGENTVITILTHEDGSVYE